jgi:hypothetical protein
MLTDKQYVYNADNYYLLEVTNIFNMLSSPPKTFKDISKIPDSNLRKRYLNDYNSGLNKMIDAMVDEQVQKIINRIHIRNSQWVQFQKNNIRKFILSDVNKLSELENTLISQLNANYFNAYAKDRDELSNARPDLQKQIQDINNYIDHTSCITARSKLLAPNPKTPTIPTLCVHYKTPHA